MTFHGDVPAAQSPVRVGRGAREARTTAAIPCAGERVDLHGVIDGEGPWGIHLQGPGPGASWLLEVRQVADGENHAWVLHGEVEGKQCQGHSGGRRRALRALGGGPTSLRALPLEQLAREVPGRLMEGFERQPHLVRRIGVDVEPVCTAAAFRPRARGEPLHPRTPRVTGRTPPAQRQDGMRDHVLGGRILPGLPGAPQPRGGPHPLQVASPRVRRGRPGGRARQGQERHRGGVGIRLDPAPVGPASVLILGAQEEGPGPLEHRRLQVFTALQCPAQQRRVPHIRVAEAPQPPRRALPQEEVERAGEGLRGGFPPAQRRERHEGRPELLTEGARGRLGLAQRLQCLRGVR